MPERIVAIPLIRGTIRRGGVERKDLHHSVFAIASWKWWCRHNRARLVLIERPRTENLYEGAAPTFQRWAVPQALLEEFGFDAEVAVVDADTMVRWDTPDLFEAAGGELAAVRGNVPRWIHRSTKAYQHLFPDVPLPWWEYFNAGLVVLGRSQLTALRDFVGFARDNRAELQRIQALGDYGSDQTPLNFFLRQRGQRVRLLPPPYNILGCFTLAGPLNRMFEVDEHPDWSTFDNLAFGSPEAFDFVEFGYVWHFTTVIASRYRVMRETWARVAHRYPGADDPDDEVRLREGVLSR
jgi:hypothetical protein